MKNNTLFALLLATIVLVVAEHATAQPHWGEITFKGWSGDYQEWSGVLWGIPWGQDWIATCRATPAPAGARVHRRPSHCVPGTNVWGVWYVPDPVLHVSGYRYCNGWTCRRTLCGQDHTIEDPGLRAEWLYGIQQAYWCLFCRSGWTHDARRRSSLRNGCG
ncbi:MAG TPA: hypothetical protein VHK90_07815 [Thermoanaerobaculia bacterium]|nr:hypothetical protein [Thermoanaerobaculia bacterium]